MDDEHNNVTCSHQRMIAEVGTGAAWEYGDPIRTRRWCFGIDGAGRIAVSLMEERTELDKYGRPTQVFRVHQNIEQRFPYGLSNVGLLVQNGRKVDPPRDWPHFAGTRARTALAWSGGHIFFVTIPERPGGDLEPNCRLYPRNSPTNS